ncbi:hypothetical protein SAMN05216420_10644 [Nitrosospira sp. Nl5]|uniref:hypothetical protein n=1 Tax=Nitrosospira sp. Nl5 TaxID=200120 RepID=UPI00088FA8DE|nr:hypothetical protein [Nitrosospira sp. Nl5]SCY42614.1 hypothetical protein SAMN05216420_10644 [Nitrosospira sp. Nl5]
MSIIKNLWAITALCAITTSAFSQQFPVMHPDEIITKYGKPDRMVSTEYDKPRPPFVTLLLVYTKEHVRFAFLPTAPIGSPPPYKSWYLIGIQDPRDNSVISGDEATQRMRSRGKK